MSDTVKIKVRVTQDHIDLGLPELTIKHPLALAVHDVTGLVVQIDDPELFVNKTDKPQKILAFIDDIEAEQDTEPFDFKLHIGKVAV